MIYIPAPERRPLLSRPLKWAGGLTPLALLIALALAGPIVLGLCAAAVEFEAIDRPDR